MAVALEFALNRPAGEDDSYRGTGEKGQPADVTQTRLSSLAK